LENGKSTFILKLKANGFKVVESYDEAQGGFGAVWEFMIVFKDLEGRELWDSNQAEIDLQLQKRAIETTNGSSPFKFFDGATMASYQFPSRPNQDSLCRNRPAPEPCFSGLGFDSERPHMPANALEVNDFGIFAKRHIPKDSYLALDEAVDDMLISASSVALLNYLHEAGISDKWDALNSYIRNYSYKSSGFSGEYTGTTFASSTLLNSWRSHDLHLKDRGSVVFRRNFRDLEKEVWSKRGLRPGEELVAQTIGGHSFK